MQVLAQVCFQWFVPWSALSAPQGLHAFSLGPILKCDLSLSSLGDSSFSLCLAN